MPAPGVYDLTGEEARRGGEWLTGIARLMQARFSETTAPLVTPYLDIVRAFNPPARPRGLSRIAADRARAAAAAGSPDRLRGRAEARKRLIDALRRDTQARVVDLDGWTALPAFVPPNERRGLVLIDPPFEQKDEFERLADGFAEAFAKWPTGSYLMWYPVKSRRATDDPGAACRGRWPAPASRPGNACGWNSASRRRPRAAGLTSTGLLIVNPPWTLAGELKTILPELEKPLGQGGAGRFRLETPKP